MNKNKYKKIAEKYAVDDLPGSLIPGSRLNKFLEKLELSENCVTEYSLLFLKKNGFAALFRYAKNEISYEEFFKQACLERLRRVHIAKIREAKEKAKQEEEKKILASNRKLIKLEKRYGLYSFIEQDKYPKVMNIIHKIESCLRLSEKDILWLETEGKAYFTDELKRAYHMLEASYYEKKFKKDKNPWSVVNASSHFRKCNSSGKSLLLLSQINLSRIRNAHLKSAICTTKGGCMRDLRKLQEALKLGNEAHAYNSKSFHPCTLIGAVNYEIGNYIEGDLWFQKAQQRGATIDSSDHEIKSIYRRADREKKKDMRQHLLQLDPYRYSWAKR
ncbi:MAG: hypothetical protein CR955_01690 [Thiotrichales bacterium]|nr:MAG: hypothetical protein CR955_01690 [Thiotrichales bacterium]